MSIRFEKDSGKATNGPMFFFSILRDETFMEEIRNAFISGLSFYAYRFPGDSMLAFGSSEGFIEGIGSPGFLIGMFNPDLPYITIPYSEGKRHPEIDSLYEMPGRSTTREEYASEVDQIIRDLKGKRDAKVVAARVIVRNTDFDIAEKFYELCQKYPDAFVFCFGTPATGCWLGVSPELLLSSTNNQISTMALAGTRSKKTAASLSDQNQGLNTDHPWDLKNIEEQEIVANYILEKFRQQGLTAIAYPTFTKEAGKVEHICTPISATLPDEVSDKLIADLLRTLSPTPALCGHPKEFALQEIRSLEKFNRGCYGGFCGPYHSPQDFSLNVVIRCAAVSQKNYAIYVGGGITSRSEVDSEWQETESKIPF
ncbi:MAG: chorismate-binding protein [Muribaculaceae bacterium]|nr:chorismate-binding protein [Muribaculaceae bacterium]